MSLDTPGVGRDRVLFDLKTKGPQSVARMAKRLGVTPMAVRQHLSVLEGEQLVDFTEDRSRVGRPARVWRLTTKAYDRFPDHHAELAVGMLQAVQSAFGDEGLERLTKERNRQQAESYRTRMPASNAPIEERVDTLARLRREEGYMAESRRRQDGTFELVENHCSIAKAARYCSKLCTAELSLFRTVLGDDVSIERTAHILAGDRSCSYCITERPSDSSSADKLRSRARAKGRRTKEPAGGAQ